MVYIGVDPGRRQDNPAIAVVQSVGKSGLGCETIAVTITGGERVAYGAELFVAKR